MYIKCCFVKHPEHGFLKPDVTIYIYKNRTNYQKWQIIRIDSLDDILNLDYNNPLTRNLLSEKLLVFET